MVAEPKMVLLNHLAAVRRLQTGESRNREGADIETSGTRLENSHRSIMEVQESLDTTLQTTNSGCNTGSSNPILIVCSKRTVVMNSTGSIRSKVSDGGTAGWSTTSSVDNRRQEVRRGQ